MNKDFIEMLKQIGDVEVIETRGVTVPAHYGMNEKDFNKIVKTILCSLLNGNKLSDTLDEQFKNFSAEDRIKVFAFCIALEKFKRVN